MHNNVLIKETGVLMW